MKSNTLLLLLLLTLFFVLQSCSKKDTIPQFKYVVSMEADQQLFRIQFEVSGLNQERIRLKMPAWMPGYYQLMHYGKNVKNLSAEDSSGKSIAVIAIDENTWEINGVKGKYFRISYDVLAQKQFVANSFLDTSHAYIVPTNNFLYVEGCLNHPVKLTVNLDATNWVDIATGLIIDTENNNTYSAPNYDEFYDSPILIGNLESLNTFQIKDVNHYFKGYQIGDFDHDQLMNQIKKVVEASVSIFDDIPYREYTFIAIGPGRGGIEHLNNTTISFNGNELKTQEDFNRVLNFIGHEYFHHYNAKRIRPFELGPFDYDKGNRTNQLWVAEGLTVYYEYLITKRAGIKDEKSFFKDFENNINAVENNPGRHHQSLAQASYNTWHDGPFGTSGQEKNKTISYYDKGPVVGLLLDFAIRNATENKKSLDDVMRYLYQHYYKELDRGFTEAEFQQVCENIAATSLSELFEYVYTTKELDYEKYLGYAGLTLRDESNTTMSKNYRIVKIEESTTLQQLILNSWLSQ